ncbi:hypothetical protein BOTBODRAFT_107897, partial [Botryobasidium botryosum FD-172 SS1]
LKRRNNALRMSKVRTPQKQQNAVAAGASVLLKEGGIITEETREGIRDLLVLKVPAENVNAVIHTVAHKILGANVSDSIDRRSVSRIALEGLLAAEMQSVYEVHAARATTLSNNGTTNKHVNYESQHGLMVVLMYLPGSDPSTQLPEETVCVQRFFGITQAPNHQSKTQLQGWVDAMQQMHDTYNGSPMGKCEPQDWCVFTQLVKGMCTNHANNQKNLFQLFGDLKTKYEAELLGEAAFQSPNSLEDVYPILAEEIEHCIEDAGGEAEWEALEAEERQERERHAYHHACVRIGKERIDAMSPEEHREIALFIWAGCCMHKELDAFKGGAAAINSFRVHTHGLPGLMKLLNIDNAAAARAGGAARERAMAALQAGGVKLASLAGAIFAHKDKKRGQQDTHFFHLEASFGRIKRFPNTSNGRYGSHGHAAAELIARLDFYRQFLELIRDIKETQGWTNIERNIYDGLHNPDTLAELTAMALYTEHMSNPYMRFVRGTDANLLDLGDYHQRAVEHLIRLKTTPRLALPPTADYKTAVLDGKPWTRPDLIEAIARLAPTLPHLEAVFVAFCEGALETWGRFTGEYDEGGAIASASPAQHELAFMKPTNNHNEGTLGSMRVCSRQAPRMTLEQQNTCAVYCKNNTAAFIRLCLGKEDRRYLRRLARERDASKRPAKCRKIQVVFNIQMQKSRNEVAVAWCAVTAKKRLDFPRTNIQDIKDNPGKNKPLMKELDWHQRFDKEIPKKCKTTSKELMVQALIGAVERRAECKARGENLSKDEAEIVKATVVLEDEFARDDYSNDKEEGDFY